jgi:hypothetical protein
MMWTEFIFSTQTEAVYIVLVRIEKVSEAQIIDHIPIYAVIKERLEKFITARNRFENRYW